MAWVAKAGELYTRLTLRDSKFRKGLSKTLTRLRPVGQAMMRISRIARNMLLGGLGLGAMAVRSAARFEQSMARIRAITNVTRESFTKLTKIALELGRTTVWTAVQAAEAEEKLARAGFRTREIIDTLPATLNLATAAQMDLATAAQISAGILRGMKLPTDQARKAMDVLAAAANSSNTNVAELGNGMRFIGPIAVQTGRSLEEVVAVMQTLADVQIRGSMAGTSLRRILSALAGGSRPTVKLMKSLSVNTADAAGQMRPLAEIIDELNAKLADMGQMERTAAIMQAFGQRAGPAMMELLTIGGNAIRDYKNRLEDAGGVASRMATVQLNTLQGAITRLRSAMEGFMIRTGSQFTKMVRGWVEYFTSFLEVLHQLNEKEFAKLIANVKTTGKVLLGLWIIPQIISAIAQSLIALALIIGGKTIVAGITATAAGIAYVVKGCAALGTAAGIAGGLATAAVTAIVGGIAILGWEIKEIISKSYIAKKLAFDLAIYSKTINRVMEELTKATKERDKAAEKGGKNLAVALEREIALHERLIEIQERDIIGNKYMGEAARETARMLIAKSRERIKWLTKEGKLAEEQIEQQEEARRKAREKGLAAVGTGAAAQAAKDLGHKFIGVTEMWKTLSTVGLTTEQKQLETERRILEENKKQTTSLRILAQRAGLPMQISGDMFNPQPALSVVP